MAPSRMERATLSLRQAASRLGVDRRVIRRAIANGSLAAHRLGARNLLIRVGDLDRWLAGHAVAPSRRAEERVERLLARESRST
jgi:excisionase family DNA binding protein